jgi:hypothetical protein
VTVVADSEPPTPAPVVLVLVKGAVAVVDVPAPRERSFSFLSPPPPTSIDEDDELASFSFLSRRKKGCVSRSDLGVGREDGDTARHFKTRSRKKDSVLLLAADVVSICASSVSVSFPAPS